MSIQEVSVDELAAAIESSPQAVRIVDVREPHEYVAGHVADAILVVLGTVPQHVDEFRSPEGAATYVICRSGGRSMQAAQYLAEQGVETINVAGGTMAWVQSGRPVVMGDQPS